MNKREAKKTIIDLLNEFYNFKNNQIDWNKIINETVKKRRQQRIVMSYKDYFFKMIKDVFEEKLKREKKLPIQIISEKLQIPINDVGNYLTSYPYLLFYYLNKGFKTSTTYIETLNIRNNEILSFKGMFLGHALSPHKESIALLAELGGFMRVTENFNFSDSRKIMLAGKEWGEMNWVVKDLNLKSQLKFSNRFREELYKILNLDVINETIWDIKSEQNKEISYNYIKALSDDYEKISKLVFGNKYIGRKLNNSEKKELLKYKPIESIIKDSSEKIDLLTIDTFRPTLEKHLNVIKQVINKLGRIDEETFQYFLIQRYSQHKFNNYIKVGVKREISFDTVFMKLDSYDNYQHSIGGIYYDDYYFAKEGKTKLSVHPYYFPSGELYLKYPNPLEAEKKAILIFDDIEKIKSLLTILDSQQTALLLSDLLSFYHFANFDKNRLRDLLFKLPKGNEIVNSWDYYTKDFSIYNKEIDLFSQSIFSMFNSAIKLPYYFFPYMIALEESENGINENVRETYSKIIDLLLSQLREITNINPWGKK